MVKLTKAMRDVLNAIVADGPSSPALTKSGRFPAAVHQLVAERLIEPLNRMRPGTPVYEITPAGRALLTQRGTNGK